MKYNKPGPLIIAELQSTEPVGRPRESNRAINYSTGHTFRGITKSYDRPTAVLVARQSSHPR